MNIQFFQGYYWNKLFGVPNIWYFFAVSDLNFQRLTGHSGFTRTASDRPKFILKGLGDMI